jgi:P27 family predicted phage terminase small subunit
MKGSPVIRPDLCPEAKKFLSNVIEVMKDNDLMTSLDFDAVELLGITYHNWFKAQQTVIDEGQFFVTKSGDKKVHPCVKIALDEKIQLTKLFEALGMTPKARKEINKSKERERELSPMDKFLKVVGDAKS